MKYFTTIFLEEAEEFVFKFGEKIVEKIFYNIRRAELTNESDLFKKLQDDIWEFRILYMRKEIRLLAFWDKTDKTNTLVLATNGFIKKRWRTPPNEIEKAKRIRTTYFEGKEKNKNNKR